MKKCASCTKDLPDAALHCVFCGAKQPPAPAVQSGLGRTAFGYSANEVVEQMRRAGGGPAAPRTAPAPMPPPGPPAQGIGNLPTMAQMPPPRAAPPPAPPAFAPTAVPPPTAPPMRGPPAQPYGAGPQGGFVPSSAANAKTMFVQAGGPPAQPQPMPPQASGYPPQASGYPPPQAMAATLVPPPSQPSQLPSFRQPYQPSIQPSIQPPIQPSIQPPIQPSIQPSIQPQAMTMPAPIPARPVPIMAIPAAQPPPYLASQTASRLIRPIEPWRDGLRAWMFLGGLALLAAFAVPLQTSPALHFHWNAILDGQGIARLPPLLLGAIGLLGILLAVMPMPVAPRGLLAALLGLAGIAVPIALVGVPPWQALAPLVGVVLLVPSLLVRNEYRDALVARLFVTLGVIGILLPFLVPQNDAIPLVSVFKRLIDLPGSQKIEPALNLCLITTVVMSLLAWLPAPVTGGAKVWAWLLILWALFVHAIHVVLAGDIGAAISGAPNQTILAWVAGGAAGPVYLVGSAYLVLIGYGLASVIGKQLE